jgi:hypothetical protein
MVAATFKINGDEYTVDWEKAEMGLFHQINRVIDMESGGDEQTVYFNQPDFNLVKSFIADHFYLINQYEELTHNEIHIILDGRYITLKINE